MAYSGSEGYFFEFVVKDGERVVGEHSLLKPDNKLVVNMKEDGLLYVYNTIYCKEYEKGKIVVTDFNTNRNTISGTYMTDACSNGTLGVVGKKNINGAFKEIPLVSL